MDEIIKRWHSLQAREQKLLSAGGIFFLVIFIYLGLWQPVHNHLAQARTEIIAKQKLLNWMTIYVPQLKNSQGKPVAQIHSFSQALAFALKDTTIRNVKTSLLPGNKISLQFVQVPFDEWLVVLENLQTYYPLTIEKLVVEKATESGLVNVEMMLK